MGVTAEFPELAYDRKGSGEPLVLLHGFGHRRQMWEPIFDRLAENYDVIAVDQAGFGWSPALPWGTRHDAEHMAAAIAAQFPRWGIEQAHLAGNSLGGAVALELAKSGHAKSVTCLSPMGWRNTYFFTVTAVTFLIMRGVSWAGFPKLTRFALKQDWFRKIAFAFLHVHPERVSFKTAYGEGMSFRYSTAYERAGIRALLYRFRDAALIPARVPITIAWATADRVLPYSMARKAKRDLPAATHIPLPDCGHVTVVDQPEMVYDTIVETISRAKTAA